MNLPNAYARLIAAKPKLAVCGLKWVPPKNGRPAGRWLAGTALIHPAWAEALIESKLLRALPKGTGLAATFDPDEPYRVLRGDENELPFDYETASEGDTPLAALMEFHVPGCTQEPTP